MPSPHNVSICTCSFDWDSLNRLFLDHQVERLVGGADSAFGFPVLIHVHCGRTAALADEIQDRLLRRYGKPKASVYMFLRSVDLNGNWLCRRLRFPWAPPTSTSDNFSAQSQ